MLRALREGSSLHVLVPVALALACGALRVRSPELCLDDSYIHLAYARSLRLGEGLSYNPFDWETGATSPLWVVLLALWPGALPDGVGVKLVGLVFHALATGVLACLTLEMLQASLTAGPSAGANVRVSTSGARVKAPLLAALAASSFAVDPLALQAATSGMEVSLATALALGLALLLARARYGAAALLAALASWTRPELAVFATAASVGVALVRRSRAALLTLLAAACASAATALYCQAVSGHPLPNTYYVKGRPFALEQLAYLAGEVLPAQPYVLSGVGAVLCLYGLWRAGRVHGVLAALLGAAGLCLLATASTRVQYPGVQFAQSRYFAPLLWLLPLAAAAGAAELRRVPAGLGLGLPLALALVLGVRGAEQQRAQEQGVTRLHVEPARFVSALDDVRVLGVEGAGALRYFTPRQLRVVDVVGLNDRALAHVRGKPGARICQLLRAGITHFAYPEPWSEFLGKGFELEPLARFTQRAYAQTQPALDWTVIVARVRRVQPEQAQACGQAPGLVQARLQQESH